MDSLLKDLRYALRGLRRRPVFTLVAIVSLALGIGANGTVFSLVHGMLYRSLPGVESGDRLVRIHSWTSSFDFPLGLSNPNYLDIEEATGELFTSTMAQVPGGLGVSVAGRPAEVRFGLGVVGDYFETLGTRPAAGRLFTGEDVDAHERVVVVRHAFWQDELGGDPSAIGRSIELNGEAFTLVGVTPPGFSGTEVLLTPDLWVPLTSAESLFGPGILEERASHGLRMTARLRPGVELESVEAALAGIGKNLVAEYPEENKGDEVRVMPEDDARIEAGLGDVSRLFGMLLLALVGGVLLIACANVANLLLARADSRRKELALRVAIGAGHWPLVRQHLVESLVLAVAGGAVGVGLAFPLAGAVAAFRPPGNMPVQIAAEPDGTVLLFMALVTVVAGLIFGVAPAVRATRIRPAGVLRSTPEGSGGRSWSLGSVLVVGQMALSLVLLVAAGLFLRSLQEATRVDLGFDAEGVGTVTFDVATAGLDEEQGRALFERVEQRVRDLPGIRSATLASPLPMDWWANGASLGFDRDLGGDQGDEMIVLASWVGDDYFETLGTPVLSGRAIAATDGAETRPVMLVNEALAEKVWPGESPVGRTVHVNGRDEDPVEIIGVVPTGKYRLPGEAPRPYAFFAFEQDYRSQVTVAFSTERPLTAVLQQVREEILALEPNLAIQDAQPFEVTVESRILGPISMIATLSGAFGLVGLILAAIGLYGVMALQVVQRTREIGIRMALGARAGQVLASVLKRGARLAAIGLVVGGALAFAVTRVIGSFLVGVDPADPATIVVVVVTLGVVTVVASLAPAVRASHVDPVRTLKSE